MITKNSNVVGVYRLIMKTRSDNFRLSVVQDVINLIYEQDVEVVIYETVLRCSGVLTVQVFFTDFTAFKGRGGYDCCESFSCRVEDVEEKVYTRDVFSRE